MQELKERILSECKSLGRNMIKVDSFLNHQVDPDLMLQIGKELAERLSAVQPTKVLTVETGGIAPAFATAAALHVPLVFARKHRPLGMPSHPLQESTLSQTEERIVQLLVSPEFLLKSDRVLIIDDFLTSAQNILALARLSRASGAQVVGVGAVIEKTFEHGREALKALNVPVESLVAIEKFEDGQIVFSR
jgi:xanthine phosphoribosyltransferase